tara:strand:- start:4454 stop:4672 length:219 start_codon:yes stop_codon:yes gene_type:complete
MTNEEITKLALDNGFKLKPQQDGKNALNSYVFLFARAIIDASTKEILEEHPLPALADNERVELNDFIKQGLL